MKMPVLFIVFIVILRASATPPPETMIKTENSCHNPIWIAVVSALDSPEIPAASTGFVLFPGESAAVFVPSKWSGFVWARTHCAVGPAAFLCLTGDCGSGAVACTRARTRVPPRAATVAHFTAAVAEEEDAYEFFVSKAAEGFNVALVVSPSGGSGSRCTPTEFLDWDLDDCPEDLRVLDGYGHFVGCESTSRSGGGDDSPRFACFAASYHIRFCASSSFASPKHSSHRVDSPFVAGYKPYNQDELGSENEPNSKKKDGLTLTVIAILGSFGGVGVFGTSVWWFIKKFRNSHTTTVNCFNFFNVSISTTQNPNNDIGGIQVGQRGC